MPVLTIGKRHVIANEKNTFCAPVDRQIKRLKSAVPTIADRDTVRSEGIKSAH